MTPVHLVPALRRLLARPDAGSSSDAQLLHRFVNLHDESAFELLVWRHGPMVLGVCRRILRDEHDAEDAFQATLLALARKAGAIGKRESVGSWLYKVAYRVALRLRDGALRRARHERHVPELPAVVDPRAPADPSWEGLRPVLDEELSRLAEKHRAPVVLCYLEGLTNEEAARQLRCPVGTVKTRLAHARRLLGESLTRRGLALGAGLLAAEAIPSAASAALPASLVGATVRIAVCAAMGKITTAGAASAQVVALTEGVLRAMMVTKLKQAVVVLMVGLAFVGAGTVSYRALAAEPAEEGRSQAESSPAKASPAQTRVKEIKNRISELKAELSRAEEAAARERAVPPRQKPVAVIFGNVPITRDELAEHLLSRMTADQLNRYVNRRILEHAARKEGISVTEAEVEHYCKAEMARANLPEATFREQLRGRHTTLRDWKEDVIRTQLLLKKLTANVRVQEKDLRREFEKRYGEKVECRLILFPQEQRETARCTARRLREKETTFEKEQNRQGGGNRPPLLISRHHTPSGELEKAVFALRPGQVSEVIEVSNAQVILQCVRHIAADRNTPFEDVRDSLKREVQERLNRQDMTKLFESLKAEAKIRMLWTPREEKEGSGR